MDKQYKILQGDVIEVLNKIKNPVIQTCITSPPYFGLRDYGVEGQIGNEKSVDEYVNRLVVVFRSVRKCLKDDGTLWLNLGDSYAGSGKGSNPDGTPHESTLKGKQGTNKGTVTGINKPNKARDIGLKQKDLIGVPWRVAFALQADGWYLRQDIIWAKNNPMPESVKDRCTKSHEYIFLLSKSKKYYYDNEAIKEPIAESTKKDLKRNNFDNKGSHGNVRSDLARNRKDYIPESGLRNKRSVWNVNTKPFKGAHFAVFPEELITPCILAGSKENDIVLDPFNGSGTTGVAALRNKRIYIGIDLNPDYIKLSYERIKSELVNG